MQRWRFFMVMLVAVLAIDQTSKTWIVGRLALGQSIVPIEAVYPYFQITHTANMGASFGMLAGADFAGTMFLAIALAVSVGMVIYYATIPLEQRAMRFGLVIVISGALGNAIDRVIYGHVVDFIHYQIPGLISNVSNLADHAIVGGVIIMLIMTWRDELGTPAHEEHTTEEERADHVRE